MGSRHSGPCSCFNGQSYQGCQNEKTLKGMALTATHFSRRRKVSKRLCPGVRHFAEAQCSLATVSIRGHRLRFASLHLLSMNAAAPHGAVRLPPDEHLRSACRRGKKARSKTRSRAPHPSPLPEGEGTDRGVWKRYADLRYALNSGFEKHTNQPLSLHSRRDRGLTGVFGRGTPTCDTALNSGFEKHTNQPLSLHSRRDRGLTEVFGGATPTCDTELNSGSKKQKNRPPIHEVRGTDRGF
jgi:hypothetical protein